MLDPLTFQEVFTHPSGPLLQQVGRHVNQSFALVGTWPGLDRAAAPVGVFSQVLERYPALWYAYARHAWLLVRRGVPCSTSAWRVGGLGRDASQFLPGAWTGAGLLHSTAAFGEFACIRPAQRPGWVGTLAGACLVVLHASRAVAIQAALLHSTAVCRSCRGTDMESRCAAWVVGVHSLRFAFAVAKFCVTLEVVFVRG